MYKLREGVELPKTFKIKVTPEQSEAVQKHLFSNGVSWASGSKEVANTEYPFLFVSENTLMCATTLDFFTKGVSPEISFPDYFESGNSATDLVLKFLQKHDTKISTEVYAKRGGDDYELEIKAEVEEKGVYTRFEVTLNGKEIGKANTFISTVSAVLGLNPVGLKAHELARENAILRSALEAARNFDREYYKLRMYELRKKIYELTKAKKKNIPAKWCIKVTYKNREKLNAYLHANSSKYAGYSSKWVVKEDVYFYSESPGSAGHSHYLLLPGFKIIKTKQFKQLLNEKIS